MKVRGYPHTLSGKISSAAPYGFEMERGDVGAIDDHGVTIQPLTRHRTCTETSERAIKRESKHQQQRRDVRRNQYLDTGEMRWGS